VKELERQSKEETSVLKSMHRQEVEERVRTVEEENGFIIDALKQEYENRMALMSEQHFRQVQELELQFEQRLQEEERERNELKTQLESYFEQQLEDKKQKINALSENLREEYLGNIQIIESLREQLNERETTIHDLNLTLQNHTELSRLGNSQLIFQNSLQSIYELQPPQQQVQGQQKSKKNSSQKK